MADLPVGTDRAQQAATDPDGKMLAVAAYAQQIVTTRLLYYLHDRTAQLSRMQRIYPHAW